ncbi:hypothetical protein B7P02_15580 [Bordetella bronchiseptica]|uniref:S26 family signal peptidase n=1 Tax=Bordetella bronchiseptica TaxID=518 RepID=UPI000D737D9B|nr:hypothetical protein B7P02_15580 [Bordetella bronchiseptica]
MDKVRLGGGDFRCSAGAVGLRARLAVVGLACGGLLALLAPAWMGPLPRLVYNPSDSAPRGFYAVEPVAVQSGDWIVTRLPADVIRLAAERDYLPAGVPLLKRVAAVTGDQVCVRDAQVWINGAPRAAVRSVDRLGRPLQAWRGCRVLTAGELFLLNTARPASFDSRYFGPILRQAVYGQATPVWTWGSVSGCDGFGEDDARASAAATAAPAQACGT